MDCEVVVVGGGIGGLTVAALLARRGVDVCLFERESQVGGCAANFEKFGYNFDRSYGLFSGWQPGEIHEHIFAELAVSPPGLHRCEPAYSVRLPDSAEVSILSNDQDDLFASNLRQAFPECAEAAVAFYRKIAPLSAAWKRALQRSPDLLSSSKASRVVNLMREGLIGNELLKAAQQTIEKQLEGVSNRFRRFVDVQLETFTQSDSTNVSYLAAALTLTAPREGLFGLHGGAAALTEKLAESIKKSGGQIRLNSPVLRLSHDAAGAATGVDLLSGEVVTASKAIVSNLTVWDTYGKLVGLNRTPSEIRKQLNALRSWGVYQMYLGLDEAAAVPVNHVLALTEWLDHQPYNPEVQFFFTTAAGEGRAPAGKKAVTIHIFTDVDDWFTYHQDETELETADQQMLEQSWTRLHAAIPELGSQIEVIDTATPRSFYELTRRKLGMVGGLPATSDFWLEQPAYLTSVPNLFLVNDTAYPGGIEGLTRSAWLLTNQLTGK
ncbi:MAG TPA: FAD-dependent oxidoreductase [Pyrinomonadaceae bacterium]|nr:FAD-dependent oxidoreductase [Pyrinomonadaceae bacterium]